MSDFRSIKFDTQKTEFVKVLKKRVNQYFKDKNISKYNNFNMILKTVIMILIYFVPFSFVLSGTIETWWINLILWAVMGIGMAGIGMGVMHDANHGSYSKYKNINTVLGYIIHFVGGSATNWKLQHNVLHHTYTNISGMDEDLDSDPIMRFSPDQKSAKPKTPPCIQ